MLHPDGLAVAPRAGGLGDTRRNRREGDALLPLSDIAFLLLVFFMLAGQLQMSSPVPLPESRGSQQTTTGEVVIILGTDDTVILNGTAMSIATFENELEQRLRPTLATSASLYMHQDATAVHALRLSGALQRVGIDTVHWKTRPHGATP